MGWKIGERENSTRREVDDRKISNNNELFDDKKYSNK
jgi:hypothetical protein